MDDDEPRWPTRAEFKLILPTHPGIIRKLEKPKPCTGFVTTGFSFKKQRENRLPRCKNNAYWVWRGLKRWRYRGSGKVPVEYYCWSHLMHRGVWGGMDEEARTYRWLAKLGYPTPTED